MDFELEATRPSSRRSRPLAWLAAISGLLLVLIALGSAQATAGMQSPSAASSSVSHAGADPITTSGIVPSLTPLRTEAAGIDRHQATTLPESERHILILLILVCFAVMAVGVQALLKREWRNVIQRQKATDT
jgi:hypothetical protein